MELLAAQYQDSLQTVLVLVAGLFLGLLGYCFWHTHMASRMTEDQRRVHSYLLRPVTFLVVGIVAVFYSILVFTSGLLDEALAYFWNNLQFW